jgi:TPR repeat protein
MDENDESTRNILKTSANLGYRDAQVYLANRLSLANKPEKGHCWNLIAAAVGNDPEAQFQVARHFHKGVGTSRNFRKAFYYAKRAAENGHAAATGLLGIFYKSGIGCGSSDIRAFDLIKKAAEMGDLMSSLSLGNFYLGNDGVAENRALAFHWYKIAAGLGDIQATYNLAECYDNGIGCQMDLKLAKKLYQRVRLADEKDNQEYGDRHGNLRFISDRIVDIY